MAEPRESVATVLDELRERYRPTADIQLAFDGWTVRVVSNSAETLECLSSYYHRFQCTAPEDANVVYVFEGDFTCPGATFELEPPEPGKTKIKHAFRELSDGRWIRKVETGMQFFVGDSVALAVGPCKARLAQVINFINTRYIDHHLRNGCLLCHAAGVAFRDRGLTLAGPSGTGKSTLALHLMTHGVNFVSNDRILLRADDHGLRMLGVPKYPRINPGTILHNPNLRGMLSRAEAADLGRLSPSELWRLERKHDVWIDEIFGPERLQLAAPFSALVLLTWSRAPAPAVLEPVRLQERKELLRVLMKSPGVFHPGIPRASSPEEYADAYVRLLNDRRTYQLSGGGEFSPAVAACLELLQPSP